MKRILVFTLFMSFSFPAFAGKAPQRTFEMLSQTAVQTKNLEKVVGPFLQQCGTSNSLPDLHCRAIRGYMQRKAAARIYLTTTDVSALDFGNYDNMKFEYKVSVKGCLTCKNPATFDPHLFKDKYYITFKTPSAVQNGILKNIEIGKFSLLVDPRKLGEWSKNIKPFLAVQFLFKVEAKGVWPSKLGKGITLRMGGFRVFNRCTGKVLYSQPPSSGNAPVNKKGCEHLNKTEKVNKGPRLPYKPDGSAILQVMRSVKSKVQACFNQYQIPGTARFKISIEGKTGKIKRLRLKGDFKDTPTGTCVTNIVKKLTFPKFRKSKLTFSYRYILK